MPAFLQSLFTVFLFCLAATAHAAEPPAFGYAVICDEPALAQRLRTGIEERFVKLHVVLRDRLPSAKLFVYASRDVHDTRNTDGVSVAIAHVSNALPANLALGYIQRKEAMPPLLQAMLGGEGMLMHLNVAHMTTPSDQEVGELLDTVVTTFVQKFTAPPASAAAAGHP